MDSSPLLYLREYKCILLVTPKSLPNSNYKITMLQVDLMKSKRQLLTIIRNLTNGYIAGNHIPTGQISKKTLDKGYSHFSDVFMVSALNGDGVSAIKVIY